MRAADSGEVSCGMECGRHQRLLVVGGGEVRVVWFDEASGGGGSCRLGQLVLVVEDGQVRTADSDRLPHNTQQHSSDRSAVDSGQSGEGVSVEEQAEVNSPSTGGVRLTLTILNITRTGNGVGAARWCRTQAGHTTGWRGSVAG